MRRARSLALASVLAALAALLPTLSAQQEATAQPPPGADEQLPLERSPANASYTIEVTLEPEEHQLEAHQVVRWRNLGPEPAEELCFHLYWNAWRNNRSAWMQGNRLRTGGDPSLGKGPWAWSYVAIDELRLGEHSLRQALRYAPPDEHPEDRTVAVLDLPAPVAPGESVELELDWHAKVPWAFGHTGFRDDYFMIAHWFPKLGVYGAGGWQCRPFIDGVEFFSDFGDYDVTIVVPEGYEVAATGQLQEKGANFGGGVEHRFVQRDVHDFAWAASPDFVERRERFEAPGLPPVDLRLMLQRDHLHLERRHFDAVRAVLEHFGRWYGPYPYEQLTIVDPAFGSGTEAMEYPTLFVAGTRWLNPAPAGVLESWVLHEAGHQFWQGLVANDEGRHAWLDEGLVSFSAGRIHEQVYEPRRYVKRYLSLTSNSYHGFLPWVIDDVRFDPRYHGYRAELYLQSGAELADALAVPAFRQLPRLRDNLNYDRSTLLLATLERHLGWETLHQVLATFFARWRFRHPEPEDFFAVAEEVSGRDLGWLFDQAYGRSLVFDYAVDSVASHPARVGFFQEGDGLDFVAPGGGYRSEVVVRRLGGGVFPVEVLLRFEDGSEVRRSWDGAARWQLFVEEGPVPIERAIVDPDGVLALDVHRGNNARLRRPEPGFAARKWSSKWLVWLQDFLHTMTFFI